jgi:hypothetical protein
MADTQTKYFAVGQGKVYIAPRDSTGLVGGYVHLGDCEGFTVNMAQQYFDIQESMSGNRGTVAHIPTQSDYSVEVSIKNIDGDNLARAFYGDTTKVAGATVTGEAITAYNGQMAPLKYPGVSAVTVKKGATPLVANTDYVLDAVNGTITILAGSTQVPAGAGVALTVDYTHGGVASRMRAFTQGLKDYALRFEGFSKFDGLAQIGTVHRAALDMAKSFSMINTGANLLTMSGKLLPAAEQGAGESQYFTYVQK